MTIEQVRDLEQMIGDPDTTVDDQFPYALEIIKGHFLHCAEEECRDGRRDDCPD